MVEPAQEVARFRVYKIMMPSLNEAFKAFTGTVAATGTFRFDSGEPRRALMLHLDNGSDYVIRRVGPEVPTYDDPKLVPLIGHRVELTGTVINGVLFVKKWKLIP